MNTEERRSRGSDRNGRKQGGREAGRQGGPPPPLCEKSVIRAASRLRRVHAVGGALLDAVRLHAQLARDGGAAGFLFEVRVGRQGATELQLRAGLAEELHGAVEHLARAAAVGVAGRAARHGGGEKTERRPRQRRGADRLGGGQRGTRGTARAGGVPPRAPRPAQAPGGVGRSGGAPPARGAAPIASAVASAACA